MTMQGIPDRCDDRDHAHAHGLRPMPANWRRWEDERDRLRAALEPFASILPPNGDLYFAACGRARDCLASETCAMTLKSVNLPPRPEYGYTGEYTSGPLMAPKKEWMIDGKVVGIQEACERLDIYARALERKCLAFETSGEPEDLAERIAAEEIQETGLWRGRDPSEG